jgi:hypothetical protein
MMEVTAKWKRFEELVAHVQRSLAPGAIVEHDARLPGQRSGASRQIDILIRVHVGQFELLVVIDCKDYSTTVDVKAVEEFIGLVDDVRGNKGAIVASSGFSNAARRRAREAGIDLYRFVDAESEDWSTLVTAPVVVDERGIERFKLNFAGPELVVEASTLDDPGNLVLFRRDGSEIGPAACLVNQAFNSGEISHEPGVHRVVLAAAEAHTRVGGVLHPLTVVATVEVKKTLYVGRVPLTKIQGFHNELTGATLTKGFTTDWIRREDVLKSWWVVDSLEDLAIRPVLTLQISNSYEEAP